MATAHAHLHAHQRGIADLKLPNARPVSVSARSAHGCTHSRHRVVAVNVEVAVESDLVASAACDPAAAACDHAAAACEHAAAASDHAAAASGRTYGLRFPASGCA
jgi:hypothetical protein